MCRLSGADCAPAVRVWVRETASKAARRLGSTQQNASDLASAQSIGAWRSRTNADDRLSRAPLGRIEGGDGIVEARDLADIRPQPSVPHPLDNLTQLGTIGLDDEIDRQAVDGPCLARSDDGHQRSAGADETRGSLSDVAADEIEHQVDAADVFQSVVVEIDELTRAEVERLLPVGCAPGADHVGAGFACELRHHGPDCAGGAVREHALSGLQTAELEQSLPC